MTITIYHNPACSTSRKVLAAIKDAGQSPEVVEYLKTGWTAEQLRQLFSQAGLTAAEALRSYKTQAEDLGLTSPDCPQERIIAAMLADPVLVNRPFVVSRKGTALCRPADKVQQLL